MYFSHFHHYLFGAMFGAAILCSVVLLIYSADRSKDRPTEQLVLQASQLINQGREEQGIAFLESVLEEGEHAGALRVLALEYSNEASPLYDINVAASYAARLAKISPEDQALYQRIRNKALQNW